MLRAAVPLARPLRRLAGENPGPRPPLLPRLHEPPTLLVVHHRRPPRNVPAALITLCAGCHARLHRLAGMNRWIPPALVELWVEQHPGTAPQLQFGEVVG